MAARRLAALRESFNASIDRIIEEDIPSLSASLATNFNQTRRSDPPSTTRSSRRHSSKTRYLPVRLTCLNSPETCRISSKHIAELNAIGLGHATKSNTNVQIPLHLSPVEFKMFLETSFPKLKDKEYHLMKLSANGNLIMLPSDINCPRKIKDWGRMGKSALYIRPFKDLISENVFGNGQNSDECITTVADDEDIRSVSGSVPTEARRPMCPKCFRTAFIDGNCVYCSIQEACAESAEIDSRNSRNLTRHHEELQQLHEQRQLSLPPEPSNGFTLRFRIPNHETVQRKFLAEQPFKDLFNFVGSMSGATRHFSLAVLGSPIIQSATTSKLISLSSLGISQSAIVNVLWDSSEEDSDMDLPEMDYDVINEVEIESNQSIDLTTGDGNESEINVQEEIIASLDMPLESQTRFVTIRKGNVVCDFIKEFDNDGVMCKALKFELEGEDGQDGGGVAREAFTRFWCDLKERFGQGTMTKVLNVCDKMSDKNWQAVGRILAKGYIDYKLIPLGLNKAFLISCICGYGSVGGNLLLSAIHEDMSPYEHEVYKKAASGTMDDSNKNDFCEILEFYQCSCIPKPEDVEMTFINLAKTRFVQSPKCAIDNIHEGCRRFLSCKFLSVDNVLEALQATLPTTSSVLRLFDSTIVIGEPQQRTLQYLKHFIRSMSDTELQHFMRLLTGSPSMTVNVIPITFLPPDQPIFFRTCGPVLDLPTYHTVGQLMNVLRGIIELKMWDFNCL